MSRVTDPSWVGGTPGILAGRGPTGGGRTAGLLLTCRECGVGADEESGDTLSVKWGGSQGLRDTRFDCNPFGLSLRSESAGLIVTRRRPGWWLANACSAPADDPPSRRGRSGRLPRNAGVGLSDNMASPATSTTPLRTPGAGRPVVSGVSEEEMASPQSRTGYDRPRSQVIPRSAASVDLSQLV